MFSLSSEAIRAEELKASVANPQSGACVIFEGWVRNHNEGKPVASLEYEGYEALCNNEAQTIFEEAKRHFAIETIHCEHRVGHLQIGDMAVWLGVTARHRGAAFEACQYIIDQVKARLPIWKKEHYADGHTEWVNCQECARHGHTHGETIVQFDEAKWFNAYYKRQMVLSDWGIEGQKKLAEKRILVVGAGGLGCGALPYLAGAGIGTISICDPDKVDVSNLHRQTLFSFEQIGRSKAELAAERMRQLNPMIHVKAWNERLTTDNVDKLLADCDLVLDCTDNFKTKYLLNDACYLKKIPLVYAGLYRWEGQLMVIHPDQPQHGCLRCLWPEIPDQRTMGTCAQVGILGAVAGCLGTMQAIEATKVLLNPKELAFSTFGVFDYRTHQNQLLTRARQSTCPLCGDEPTVKKLDPQTYEPKSKRYDWELDGDRIGNAIWVDIRESFEIEEDLPAHFRNLSYSELMTRPEQLNPSETYLFVCPHGIKSRILVLALREQGWNNVFSLFNGTEGERS